MANRNINIIVGGDPSGFTRAAREVTAGCERMRNAVGGPAGSLSGLSTSANATGNILRSTVVPGVNQASNALTNLGRIAQDAPFGFIGIQNNINPLLESFQRLRAETGSTGGAFRALGSSLVGAAGLGLAVSLLTSALTMFSMSSNGAKESLTGLAKAVDEANKKAGEELARVQVLNAVITDTTRKQSERSSAAKELSGILKDLNINMTQEVILNGRVTEATQRATQAIIERGKARAIEARIGELSSQQLARDTKKAELNTKLTETQKKLNQQLADRNRIQNKDQREAAGIDQFMNISAITDIRKDIDGLDKETSKANQEIAFLISQVKSADLNIDFKGSGTEKEVDLLKQRIAALKEIQTLQGLDAKQQVELAQLEIQLVKRDAVKLGFTPVDVSQQIDGILEKAFPVKTFEFDTVVTARVNKLEASLVKDPKALTDDFKTDIEKAVNPEGKPIEVTVPPIVVSKTQGDLLKDQLNASLGKIIQSTFAEIGATIGESIGNALSGTADFKNVFRGLAGLLGSGLEEIGKALIGYGAALLAFQLAVGKLNPFVAFAAGIIAVATGAAIKASLPKFAEGGVVNKATLGIFGEAGPEAVIPLKKLPGLITDSLRISLPSLIGNLTTDKQQPVIINGHLQVSGTDLSLLMERVDNRRKRLG
jgi:hypothetical protein